MRQAAYSGMHNVPPGIPSLNQADRVMRDPWNTLKSPEWGRKRKSLSAVAGFDVSRLQKAEQRNHLKPHVLTIMQRVNSKAIMEAEAAARHFTEL